MSKLSVWFASSFLLGSSACAQSVSVSARVNDATLASSNDGGASESKAWESALDDARNAWSRIPDDASTIAVRFEGERSTSLRDRADDRGSVAHAWVDEQRFDGTVATTADGGSTSLFSGAVVEGRHTIRVEVVVAHDSASAPSVLRGSIVVDVGHARSVVVRALVLNAPSGTALSLGSLDARRVGIAEKASRDLDRIDADVRKVQASLAEQRVGNDARWVRCVSDKLSQILVAKRAADDARSDLTAAVAFGQRDEAASLGTRITLNRRRVEGLASEGRQCLGPSTSLVAIASP